MRLIPKVLIKSCRISMRSAVFEFPFLGNAFQNKEIENYSETTPAKAKRLISMPPNFQFVRYMAR